MLYVGTDYYHYYFPFQLERGDIKPYMFDYAVCTLDYLEDMAKARKYIKDKFPSLKTGTLDLCVLTGSDIKFRKRKKMYYNFHLTYLQFSSLYFTNFLVRVLHIQQLTYNFAYFIVHTSNRYLCWGACLERPPPLEPTCLERPHISGSRL